MGSINCLHALLLVAATENIYIYFMSVLSMAKAIHTLHYHKLVKVKLSSIIVEHRYPINELLILCHTRIVVSIHAFLLSCRSTIYSGVFVRLFYMSRSYGLEYTRKHTHTTV